MIRLTRLCHCFSWNINVNLLINSCRLHSVMSMTQMASLEMEKLLLSIISFTMLFKKNSCYSMLIMVSIYYTLWWIFLEVDRFDSHVNNAFVSTRQHHVDGSSVVKTGVNLIQEEGELISLWILRFGFNSFELKMHLSFTNSIFEHQESTHGVFVRQQRKAINSRTSLSMESTESNIHLIVLPFCAKNWKNKQMMESSGCL